MPATLTHAALQVVRDPFLLGPFRLEELGSVPADTPVRLGP